MFAAADEQIQENAHVVVKQLVHHSECLGPALTADALGLHRIYKETFQKIADLDVEPVAESNGYKPQNGMHTHGPLLNRRSTFQFSWSERPAMDIVMFYTNLVRLLAHCSLDSTNFSCKNKNVPKTVVKRTCGKDESISVFEEESDVSAFSNASHSQGRGSTSRHKRSVICRTKSILQNLIKVGEIVDILSSPFVFKKGRGLLPCHKDAVLLFLDRVYGISCPDLLLKLLSQAFLPDVKCALLLAQVCMYALSSLLTSSSWVQFMQFGTVLLCIHVCMLNWRGHML